jgi:hypothetical protein
MIRISDLANAAALARPLGAPARVDTREPSAWFDEGALRDVQLSADPAPFARGLSVDQHAARVLAALCGEPDGA